MSVNSEGVAVVSELGDQNKKLLFWACFMALIATAFGFVIRSMILDDLGTAFNLNATEKGEINGAGLWPFALSIILFSLVVDKIGYGRAMAFAFVCHIASAILTITATGYTQLYWATFICALANGTVEAVINPVVATMFPREKVKWLSLLHAGWPGGLVLGGLLTLFMGTMDWKYKVGLLLIPTAIYGVMMIGRRWPVHERVAAGVSYKEMLKEFGVVSALLVNFLMFSELGRVFSWEPMVTGVVIVVATLFFGAFIGFAPGRPLFIVLTLIMIPLATTELGTDSWITSLMTPEMQKLGLAGGWVLVYTSVIMAILRAFAGSIVHRISPLGLLALSSGIAMVGLFALSMSSGTMILLAATLYAFGKAFFWPTMLGVVSEQFPKGGALTLNAIAGIGMLGVGIVGGVFLGYIQDTSASGALAKQNPAIHQQVVENKKWVFGEHPAVIPSKVSALPSADQTTVQTVTDAGKKEALKTVAIFPAIMLVSYLLLIAYFKSKGGYKAEMLTGHEAEDARGTPVEA